MRLLAALTMAAALPVAAQAPVDTSAKLPPPAPETAPAPGAARPPAKLKVRLSWGHRTPGSAAFYVKLVPNGVEISGESGISLEPGEGLREGAWHSRAGAGDVDVVDFTLACPDQPVRTIQNLHIIWADLIAHADPDTARRLTLDPAFRKDPRQLTIQMNREGTRGFTVTVDQLLQNRTFWVPALDVFLAVGDPPPSFSSVQGELAPSRGKRILEEIRTQHEANYDEYASLWEDMGNPSYIHPNQPAPGHIICLAWDSSIHKFGIDRGSGVRNDYGNPDHFRFWFDFGDLSQGILRSWRSQQLQDGLPVVTTMLERDGIQYSVEQFAYPLDGPPKERNGEAPLVLLERVTMSDFLGKPRQVSVTLNHLRGLPRWTDTDIVAERRGGAFLFQEASRRNVLFSIEGTDAEPSWSGVADYQHEMKRVNATLFVDLPANGSRQFIIKLPSPVVPQEQAAKLLAIDYDTARRATLDFWSGWIARGAQFRVPEKMVNDLYRANLWHALRLPRRHGGSAAKQIDLPYSNFAYSQTGTPWPVNQAAYVDYMIYDLRGYSSVAAEELAAMFHNNQETGGHVNGFANWLVYTPGMLYAVAQHYLLSGDRASLDRLLPASLKALDWCLEEVRQSAARTGHTRGLVFGPLNDGTGNGIWAFNQAYMYAGLDLFGRVLREIRHPRAGECLDAARSLRDAIDTGFHAASMRSPLVQLRDHTWIPYVPSEALTYGRILDQWYPADVDTGALHLVRLKAVSAVGELADSLLQDHEDNLFFKGWGMANEPVYNQQATAYLLRDEPQAAIRSFYSFMASAFSQSALEPVEHR
ncbi:MAG TPA: hypothetical protein VG672_23730, partial [Bryobacteraceae bacterium]|nr:hypothetical protein [Bryobacteraceae bacterium]